MSLIIKEDMERQISEMWSAINDIRTSDPDRDYAINEAQETENKLRERYHKQERLRDAAPELLKALKKTMQALEMHRYTHGSLGHKIYLENLSLIKKIES